jgi:hypothetical protein
MEAITRLKIKRNDSGGSITRLELAYDSPLGYIMLDKDMEYATLEQYNSGERKPYEIVLGKKEFFKFINIDLSGASAQDYSLEKKHYLKQRRLMDAILGHPHVKTEDATKRVTKERFHVIDESKEHSIAATNIKKRIAVGNFVNSLDEGGLRNLCAYINNPVQNLKAEEVFVNLLQERKELIGKDGRATVVEGWAYANMDKVLALKSDEFAELTIIINKAVALDIINQKDDGFWYGGRLIANSEEELRKHFKNDVDAYEKGLKVSVFEKDNLPISFNNVKDVKEAMVEIKKVESMNDINTAEAQRRASLEARASDLGVQGNIRGMKDDTLQAKIIEKEKTLAQIEMNKK